MDEPKGIVYVATGNNYLKEAIVSKESVLQHNDIPITIFVSKDLEQKAKESFENVEILDEVFHDVRDSIIRPYMLQYKKTLFLDTDTYISHPISDIFDVLDNFDLTAAYDPSLDGTPHHSITDTIPDWWPQFNTGVIGLRDNFSIRKLLNDWLDLQKKGKGIEYNLNQPAFRIVTYNYNGNIHVLPPEYNWRYSFYGGGFAGKEIKILHDRFLFSSMERIANKINKYTNSRLIQTRPFVRIKPFKNGFDNVYFYSKRLVIRYRNDGLKPTCKRVIRFSVALIPYSPIRYNE